MSGGALAEDGLFLMIDFKFSSELEENLDNPFATLYYGISTMHCMTSRSPRAVPGWARLGNPDRATDARRRRLLRVEVLDSPRPQNCIYVCQA